MSGVIKLKDGVSVGALGTNAIGYTTELTKYVIKSAYESAVLKAVMAAYEEENPSATDIQKSDRYKGYGYAYIPNSINIYCRGYGQKTAVKDAVAAISEERKAAGKSEIMVTDVMSIVLNIVKQFINIITCALLSLTAISLIVSLLMIGIIKKDNEKEFGWKLIPLLLFAFLLLTFLFYIFLINVNFTFDYQKPNHVSARVVKVEHRRGGYKSFSYEKMTVVVDGKEYELKINVHDAEEFSIGDQVTLEISKGLFGVEYYHCDKDIQSANS